jgi:signal transduction histidine kinase
LLGRTFYAAADEQLTRVLKLCEAIASGRLEVRRARGYLQPDPVVHEGHAGVALRLALPFDRMAERIGTLLTAERRLLQDVSHELGSPLARMSFAAELARTAPDREAAVARLKKEIRA